ncbi:hypothetical protein PoB_002586300 [Plakobranchus ocellatus]|uniref:Uncharacterized protein n=1 Tax=Plakobranchus ocellatus TaxID=259542 RepID=A0AAV3ZY26_9GAST|nr:hypothetical protein PoB_002586300 [Plakobranchus ocellatus]
MEKEDEDAVNCPTDITLSFQAEDLFNLSLDTSQMSEVMARSTSEHSERRSSKKRQQCKQKQQRPQPKEQQQQQQQHQQVSPQQENQEQHEPEHQQQVQHSQQQQQTQRQDPLAPRTTTGSKKSGMSKHKYPHNAEESGARSSRKKYSHQGGSEQTTKSRTTQLTPAQREYWQKKLPQGFDYYLSRIAFAVVEAQPTDVVGELATLPKKTYLEKLHQRKFGWSGGMTGSSEILNESHKADAWRVTELDPPTIHSDTAGLFATGGEESEGRGGDESTLSQQTWFTAEQQTASEHALWQQNDIIRKSPDCKRKTTNVERKLCQDFSAPLERGKRSNSSCSLASSLEPDEVFQEGGSDIGLRRSAFTLAQEQNLLEGIPMVETQVQESLFRESSKVSVTISSLRQPVKEKCNKEANSVEESVVDEAKEKDLSGRCDLECPFERNVFSEPSHVAERHDTNGICMEGDGTGFQINLGTIGGVPFQISLLPKDHEASQSGDSESLWREGESSIETDTLEEKPSSANHSESEPAISNIEIPGVDSPCKEACIQNKRDEVVHPKEIKKEDGDSEQKHSEESHTAQVFVKVRERIEQFQNSANTRNKFSDGKPSRGLSLQGAKPGQFSNKASSALDKNLHNQPKQVIENGTEQAGTSNDSTEQPTERLRMLDARLPINATGSSGQGIGFTAQRAGSSGTSATKSLEKVDSGPLGMYGSSTRTARAAFLYWWTKAVGGHQVKHGVFKVHKKGECSRGTKFRKCDRVEKETEGLQERTGAEKLQTGEKEVSRETNKLEKSRKNGLPEKDQTDEKTDGEEVVGTIHEYVPNSNQIYAKGLEERIVQKSFTDDSTIEEKEENRTAASRRLLHEGAMKENKELFQIEFPKIKECKERLFERGFSLMKGTTQIDNEEELGILNKKSEDTHTSKERTGLIENDIQTFQNSSDLDKNQQPGAGLCTIDALPTQSASVGSKGIQHGNKSDQGFSSNDLSEVSQNDALIPGHNIKQRGEELEKILSTIPRFGKKSTEMSRDLSSELKHSTGSAGSRMGGSDHTKSIEIQTDCNAEDKDRRSDGNDSLCAEQQLEIAVNPKENVCHYEVDKTFAQVVQSPENVQVLDATDSTHQTSKSLHPEVSSKPQSEPSEAIVGTGINPQQDELAPNLGISEDDCPEEIAMRFQSSRQSDDASETQSDPLSKMDVQGLSCSKQKECGKENERNSESYGISHVGLEQMHSCEKDILLASMEREKHAGLETVQSMEHQGYTQWDGKSKMNKESALTWARVFVKEAERVGNEIENILCSRKNEKALSDVDKDAFTRIQSKSLVDGNATLMPLEASFKKADSKTETNFHSHIRIKQESEICSEDADKNYFNKSFPEMHIPGNSRTPPGEEKRDENFQTILSFEGLFDLPKSLLEDVSKAIDELCLIGRDDEIPLVDGDRENGLACFKFIGEGVIFKVQPVVFPQEQISFASEDNTFPEMVSVRESAAEGTSRRVSQCDGELDHKDAAVVSRSRCTNQSRRNAVLSRSLNGKDRESSETHLDLSSLDLDTVSNVKEHSDTSVNTSCNNSEAESTRLRVGIPHFRYKLILDNEANKNSNNRGNGKTGPNCGNGKAYATSCREKYSCTSLKLKPKATFACGIRSCCFKRLTIFTSKLHRSSLYSCRHRDFSNNSNNSAGEFPYPSNKDEKLRSNLMQRKVSCDQKLVAELATLIKYGDKPAQEFRGTGTLLNMFGSDQHLPFSGFNAVPTPFCCSNAMCVKKGPEERAMRPNVDVFRKKNQQPMRWVSKAGGILRISGESQKWFSSESEKETESSSGFLNNNTSSSAVTKSSSQAEVTDTCTSEPQSITTTTWSTGTDTLSKKTFKKEHSKMNNFGTSVKGKFQAKKCLPFRGQSLPRQSPRNFLSPREEDSQRTLASSSVPHSGNDDHSHRKHHSSLVSNQQKIKSFMKRPASPLSPKVEKKEPLPRDISPSLGLESWLTEEKRSQNLLPPPMSDTGQNVDSSKRQRSRSPLRSRSKETLHALEILNLSPLSEISAAELQSPPKTKKVLFLEKVPGPTLVTNDREHSPLVVTITLRTPSPRPSPSKSRSSTARKHANSPGSTETDCTKKQSFPDPPVSEKRYTIIENPTYTARISSQGDALRRALEIKPSTAKQEEEVTPENGAMQEEKVKPEGEENQGGETMKANTAKEEIKEPAENAAYTLQAHNPLSKAGNTSEKAEGQRLTSPKPLKKNPELNSELEQEARKPRFAAKKQRKPPGKYLSETVYVASVSPKRISRVETEGQKDKPRSPKWFKDHQDSSHTSTKAQDLLNGRLKWPSCKDKNKNKAHQERRIITKDMRSSVEKQTTSYNTKRFFGGDDTQSKDINRIFQYGENCSLEKYKKSKVSIKNPSTEVTINGKASVEHRELSINNLDVSSRRNLGPVVNAKDRAHITAKVDARNDDEYVNTGNDEAEVDARDNMSRVNYQNEKNRPERGYIDNKENVHGGENAAVSEQMLPAVLRSIASGEEKEAEKKTPPPLGHTRLSSPTESRRKKIRSECISTPNQGMVVRKTATQSPVKTSPTLSWRAEGLAEERVSPERRWPLQSSPSKVSKRSSRSASTIKSWMNWLGLVGRGSKSEAPPRVNDVASQLVEEKPGRVLEFPLRLHKVRKEVRDDVQEVTRILTLEEPKKNVYVNMTFERTRPITPTITGEYGLSCDTGRLYLTKDTTETILQGNVTPTRRLICEPEAFAGQNLKSSSRQLVLENGSSLVPPPENRILPKGFPLPKMATSAMGDTSQQRDVSNASGLSEDEEDRAANPLQDDRGVGEANRKTGDMMPAAGDPAKPKDRSDKLVVSKSPTELKLEMKSQSRWNDIGPGREDRFYERGSRVRRSASELSAADKEFASEISRSLDSSRDISPALYRRPLVRKMGSVVIIGGAEDWARCIGNASKKSIGKSNEGNSSHYQRNRAPSASQPHNKNNNAGLLRTISSMGGRRRSSLYNDFSECFLASAFCEDWMRNSNNNSGNHWQVGGDRQSIAGKYCEICCCSVCLCESCKRCSVNPSYCGWRRKLEESQFHSGVGARKKRGAALCLGNKEEEEQDLSESSSSYGPVPCKKVVTRNIALSCDTCVSDAEADDMYDEEEPSIGDVTVCPCPAKCPGKRVWTCHLTTKKSDDSCASVAGERRKKRIDMVLVCQCIPDKPVKEVKVDKAAQEIEGPSKEETDKLEEREKAFQTTGSVDETEPFPVPPVRVSEDEDLPSNSRTTQFPEDLAATTPKTPTNTPRSSAAKSRDSFEKAVTFSDISEEESEKRTAKRSDDSGTKESVDEKSSAGSQNKSAEKRHDVSLSSINSHAEAQDFSAGSLTSAGALTLEIYLSEKGDSVGRGDMKRTKYENGSENVETKGALGKVEEERDSSTIKSEEYEMLSRKAAEHVPLDVGLEPPLVDPMKEAEPAPFSSMFSQVGYTSYAGTYGIPLDGGGYIDPSYALVGAETEQVYDAVTPLPPSMIGSADNAFEVGDQGASNTPSSLLDVYDKSQYHVIQMRDTDTGEVRSMPVRRESITVTSFDNTFFNENDLRSHGPRYGQRTHWQTYRKYRGPRRLSSDLLEFESSDEEDSEEKKTVENTRPRAPFRRRRPRGHSIEDLSEHSEHSSKMSED